MRKIRFLLFALLSALLVSSFGALVLAQSGYTNEQTTPVTIGSDGTFSGSAMDVGIGYEIHGAIGATGSVTVAVYSANPQPGASIPNGVTLGRFVVLTFNMNSDDFSLAIIHITYTDADISGMQTPFSCYKYVASTNTYVELPSTVDTTNKMMTVTVVSIDDPLFAIGGASVATGGFSDTAWAILAISIIVIVFLAVFGIWYFKQQH
jgi:hypothetical protein